MKNLTTFATRSSARRFMTRVFSIYHVEYIYQAEKVKGKKVFRPIITAFDKRSEKNVRKEARELGIQVNTKIQTA